jgi:multisubunit Na+/H+ antiporter MnhB subunit
VSLYGLLFALVFALHAAPDVALSQIVVGAVALPLMVLLTLAKVRRDREARRAARRAAAAAPSPEGAR